MHGPIDRGDALRPARARASAGRWSGARAFFFLTSAWSWAFWGAAILRSRPYGSGVDWSLVVERGDFRRQNPSSQ
jgi:hypothetical protein